MSDHNQHIDQKTFELYQSGKLSPEEQYIVERQLEASAFEQEAMEGLESIPVGDWKSDLEKLNRDLAGYQTQNRKFSWYSFAAVIALLVVSTWAIWIFVDKNDPILALEQDKTNETGQPNTAVTNSDSIEQSLGTLEESANEAETTVGSNKTSDNQIAESQPSVNEQVTARNDLIETHTESSTITSNNDPNASGDQIAMVEEVVEDSEDEFAAGFGDTDNDGFDSEEVLTSAPVVADSETAQNIETEEITVNDQLLAQEIIIEEELNNDNATSSQARANTTSKGKISPSKRKRSKSTKKESRDASGIALSGNSDQDLIETDKSSASFSTTTRALNDDVPQKSVTEEEYQKYLDENLEYPDEAKAANIEGSVKLIFTVNVDSTVTDFIVLQGIGSGCDEEAIRLVKEGPKWIPLMTGNKPKVSDGFQEIKFFLENK